MRLIYILVLITCGSCATVFNKKYYPIHIYSNIDSAQIQIRDNIISLPAKVKIQRSKKNLKITLTRNDTIVKTFTVKSSPDPVSAYGNLGWMYLFPVGYLIDYSTNKGFYYGKIIYLNSKDTSVFIRPPFLENYHKYFSKSFPTHEGQLNLLLSLPHINSYHQRPNEEGLKVNTGFGGFSIGTEYYYKRNKHINLVLSATTDWMPILPVIFQDFSGYYEVLNSAFINVTDNFRFGRNSFGYGINYSVNVWELEYEDRFNPPPQTRESTQKINKSFGVTMNFYHQFTNKFHTGLMYKPSFLMVYPKTSLEYEHLISIDFMWKLKLK